MLLRAMHLKLAPTIHVEDAMTAWHGMMGTPAEHHLVTPATRTTTQHFHARTAT
jgi:hypothetical protein